MGASEVAMRDTIVLAYDGKSFFLSVTIDMKTNVTAHSLDVVPGKDIPWPSLNIQSLLLAPPLLLSS